LEQIAPCTQLGTPSLDPPQPGDGEVLVRVCASGINPLDVK
jgi:NADPH:quinone reductase-like Zn-dependent oxidoreductase